MYGNWVHIWLKWVFVSDDLNFFGVAVATAKKFKEVWD